MMWLSSTLSSKSIPLVPLRFVNWWSLPTPLKVFEDIFNASTPYGTKEFRNIVGYHNKQATNVLVFSAHYDSKYFPVSPIVFLKTFWIA